MRIGISGHAGAGKSTLARDLAAALGVPLIQDSVLDALTEHVGKTSWRGVKDTRIRRTIRLQALEKKIAAEAAAESFVSDKTVVDYLAYWLQNQAEFETKESTQSVVDMVKAHVARYERVVFLPYRADVEYAEDRSQDPVHNLKVAGLKRGLLTVLGIPTVDAPFTFGEDAKAWAEKWLAAPAPKPAEPATKPKRAGKKK
jgi:predicted ATPase